MNKRSEIFGWMTYDWANSAFFTTTVGVLVGPYLIYLAEKALGADGVVLDLVLFKVTTKGLPAFSITISVILMVALLPMLGAIADYTNLKKALMAFFCYLGVLASGLLFFVHDSYIACSVLLVISNMSFAAANVFYNAFLIDITTVELRDRVSSWGYASGYLGGVVMLVLNFLLLFYADRLGITQGQAVRISFLAAALWWGLFALITFALVRSRSSSPPGLRRGADASPAGWSADGVVSKSSPPYEGGVAAASADGVVSKSSPPYEGGVAAASADGVVLSSKEENHPAAKAAPLLRKEGSLTPAAAPLLRKEGSWTLLTVGFRNLWATLKELRRLRYTMQFLIAYLFYNDGIQTVILQSSVFISYELFTSKGVPEDNAFLLMIFVVAQISALVGAIFFERVARFIGAKRTIMLSLVIWSGIVIYAYGFFQSSWQAWLLGSAIGLVLGAAQALSRSLYSQMIPKGREASFFGLYEISEKGTSWMGTLLFTIVVGATGSFRQAILALIVFFVTGLIILIFTDTTRAIHEAGNLTPDEAGESS